MPNYSYQRGSNFERELLTKLREREYDGIRSAGSHSSIDVLVWDNEQVYAVQCKTSKQESFNLSNLIWEDSVRELTGLSSNLIKVLCIKQYRKTTTLVWDFDNDTKQMNWIEADIFGLNNLTKNRKRK